MERPQKPIAARFPMLDSTDVEIRSCSKCQTRLGVPEEMLGVMHNCPACDYQFRALSVTPFGVKILVDAKPPVEVPFVLEEEAEEIIELRPAELDAA